MELMPTLIINLTESKVTALEENSGYKDMKPSEVIGRLLAYESRKGPISTPPKKQKGIALKTSRMKRRQRRLTRMKTLPCL